jgi:trimethylamine--corrinoid protein Co-methyltransferase
MINSGSTQQCSPYLRILTDDQIYEIKRAAFDVMFSTGFKVLHDGARDMLKGAGAIVRGEMVKVPEFIVNECLAKAPKGFTVFDRSGQRAMEVEGRKSYYGTNPASPNTKDARTGEIHPTTVADIVNGARVADYCENIDWVMPMGSCQDVPSIAADLHEFEAVVAHTTKPIVFIGYSARGTELVYEMAAQVAGGMDALREKPFVILYPEPISPLVFPDEVVDRLFLAADLFMPQIPGPAVQLGATGPATLAGVITQITAESLMCLTLAQLRNPGCPVCLSGNVQILDMQTGIFGVGFPEMSLGIAAQAEVAQSFGLPTWGYAGCTDAKSVDAQAGLESAFSILSQGLAGLNLIHDVGYLDMAMVSSPAQLMLGNEAIGMTKRFLQGIQVTPDTLARHVIEAVGPGGHFLQQRHTLDHFRSELWRSDLLTRQPYEIWEKAGSRDMAQRIQDKLIDILDTHAIPALPDKVRAAIEQIKIDGEAELVAAAT